MRDDRMLNAPVKLASEASCVRRKRTRKAVRFFRLVSHSRNIRNFQQNDGSNINFSQTKLFATKLGNAPIQKVVKIPEILYSALLLVVKSREQ